MLLVHPVRELIKFLPVLIGLFVASTATDRAMQFQLLGGRDPDRDRAGALLDDPLPDLRRAGSSSSAA